MGGGEETEVDFPWIRPLWEAEKRFLPVCRTEGFRFLVGWKERFFGRKAAGMYGLGRLGRIFS